MERFVIECDGCGADLKGRKFNRVMATEYGEQERDTWPLVLCLGCFAKKISIPELLKKTYADYEQEKNS
jgi:hypothetical protein